MALAWPLRVLFAGGALLAAGLACAAAPETDHGAAADDPLVGQFLVAAPDMADPLFYHAVVLVVEHGEGGALGIIVNKPVEKRSLASLLQAIGDKDTDVKGEVTVFAGGPVEPWIGFVLHSLDYRSPATTDIDGRVAVTSSLRILRDIGHDKGPHKTLVAFGYTGWGPGQLEIELARHDWFTEPEDPKLIFDEDSKKVWDDAMARRSKEL